MRKTRVALLMGGRSDEREVSLSTGRMIIDALDSDKYETLAVDPAHFSADPASPDTESEPLPLSAITGGDQSANKPDVVFIALHGKFGEDGTVQGLLELLGIPYVGSGVLTSALAIDKIMTRKVLACEGVPLPKGIDVHKGFDMEDVVARTGDVLGYPVVVKPNKQGSTIGLSIARSENDLRDAINLAFKYDSDVLLEEFIQGTEITGPVLGNQEAEALPLVEIIPDGGFYDYHAKYTPGATEEIVPARIRPDLYSMAQELALTCHRVLGCRGVSRTDMIIRGDEIFVLEVNTIPGMTPTSLLPRSAQAAGISFPELLDRLIGYALEVN